MLAFFGTLVAVTTASIAFFQWKTAQQKVVIDLQKERFIIYDDLRRAVSDYLVTTQFTPDAQKTFFTAQSRARFFFGPEVDAYLSKVRSDIITATLFDRYAPRPNQNIDPQLERLQRLNQFYIEIDKMFVPYMRIDQRMPLWWSAEAFAACRAKLTATRRPDDPLARVSDRSPKT
jgi:hypothetical protein